MKCRCARLRRSPNRCAGPNRLLASEGTRASHRCVGRSPELLTTRAVVRACAGDRVGVARAGNDCALCSTNSSPNGSPNGSPEGSPDGSLDPGRRADRCRLSWWPKSERLLWIRAETSYRPGDTVDVVINRQALTSACLRVFVPVLTGLVGGLATAWLLVNYAERSVTGFTGPVLELLLGGLGMALGIGVAAWGLNRPRFRRLLQPRIATERLPHDATLSR